MGKQKSSVWNFLLPVLVNIAVFIAFLSGFSFFLLKVDTYGTLNLVFLAASAAVAAFSAATVGSRRMKMKGILSGLLLSLIFILCDSALILPLNSFKVGNSFFLVLGAVLLFSAVGGIVGANITRR